MNDPIPDSSSAKVLPSYKNPPINEVVCGMRFQTPDKLYIPHIGLLWDKFRQEYPIIQHAPPIAGAKGEIQIDSTTGLPLQRVWFINRADDQLIQFQFDRFYFNWRRRENDYPRYTHVIKNFRNLKNTLDNFFKEFDLGELRPIEYELSYINHIPKGQGWDTLHDLPKVFSDFVWKQTMGRFLPSPENIAWQTAFSLPEGKGRLTVNLKQAIRAGDKIPLFVLELTARGIGESKDKETLYKWFDLAHEWIVQGFADLTTSEVQKVVWERENA
ncbi:MAG: TIGR04255 family protein [Thermodesulfobacteriota bacterium]